MQANETNKAQQGVEAVPLLSKYVLTADYESGRTEIYQNSVRCRMLLRSGLYVSYGDFVGRGGEDSDLVTMPPRFIFQESPIVIQVS